QGDVWYNGPVSGWAANMKYKLSPEWTVGAGVYENNPENTEEKDNANFNLSTDQAKGVLIPVELAWKTKKINQLTGEYKLGGFWSSEDYATIDGSDGKD
ncbi:carbohydrate porin, partial [Acinetobacter baumannii]